VHTEDTAIINIGKNINICQIPGVNIQQLVCSHPTPSKLFAGQKKDRIIKSGHLRRTIDRYPATSLTKKFALITQVHGNRCALINYPKLLIQADACITQQPELALSVYTADCLPILISTKNGNTIAAIHAGWKGLFNNIIPNTIRSMRVKPDEMVVWIGPSISQQHYEVSQSFREQFISKHPQSKHYFDVINHKVTFDCKGFAQSQLHTLNIHNINLSDICTFATAQLPSYRRSKGKLTQRIWTHIWKVNK
tara:strand:+ start:1893 stop:2645 length:753 start_codon:yes stop_codon:yes gene_type:complete